MKRKKISGILTLVALTSMIVLFFMVQSKGVVVPATYVKLLIVNFAFLVFFTGFYVMEAYCPASNAKLKMAVTLFGTIIAIISIFVAFNVLPYKTSWNWMVSGGILYVLLVQTQLLNWGRRNHNIVRFSTLGIILCDAFLMFFYIGLWQAPELAGWINIAAVVSVVLTFIGLIFVDRNKGITEQQ